jgi:rhamnosyl/mannosyltransferase
MKVLHIGKFFPPHHGGIETHLQDLCRGLANSATVDVIVANHARRHATEQCEQVNVRRLARIAEVAAVPICPRMVRAIRETPADIVHLHVPNPYAGAAFLLSNHRAPLVVSWHSDIVRQRFLSHLLRPLERATVRRAAALIASSHNYLETSPTLAGNRDRCHVIPYGIDEQELQRPDPAKVSALRRRYGPRIVLAVGRLVYYKGLEYLIRAMRSIDGHLLIVGDGPLRDKLGDLTAATGVSARVTFTGTLGRAELIDFYHAADVFVLPSVARSEAFGIVQLEAMACGKPVVNTQLPCGVPFVSVDGETGITVAPGAPEPLADAINRLLGDSALRTSYGAAARRRVQELFSVDLMVERTRSLYQQILDTRRAELSVAPIPRNLGTDPQRSSARV